MILRIKHVKNQLITCHKKPACVKHMLRASIISFLCALPILQAEASCTPQVKATVLVPAGKWIALNNNTSVPAKVNETYAGFTKAYSFLKADSTTLTYQASDGSGQVILQTALAAAVTNYGSGNQSFVLASSRVCS